MKKFIAVLLFALPFVSCNNNAADKAADTNLDAARNFIRAALDGKFDEARSFILQDSSNLNYMDIAERSYQNQDKATKDGYRASSILIHDVKPLNDSTTIIVYSNSYMNKPNSLKVVKKNDKWLVDFKYLYEHDWDSIQHLPIKNDSIK